MDRQPADPITAIRTLDWISQSRDCRQSVSMLQVSPATVRMLSVTREFACVREQKNNIARRSCWQSRKRKLKYNLIKAVGLSLKGIYRPTTSDAAL